MKTSKIAKESAQFVHVTTPRHLRSRDIALVQEHNESRRLDRDHEGIRSSKRKRNGTALESLTEEEIASSTEQLKQYGPIGDKMPKKARKQPARKRVSEDGKVKFDPPVNWKDFYNTTKDMRSQILAPVDTMGCESLAEEHRPPRDRRFQTLVALMLSSQTKDTVTSVAMKNLQQHLPGGFTLESVLQVEPGTLNDLIAKVGFHNNKTKFIKATAVILKEQHGGDIPSTIEGLLSLPGVGPKMAFLCMSAAWGRDEGIGVDVHVHRITNLWGWHKTSTPEETRIILESWLPRDKWHDINNLLVGFGQTWCPPVGRKCSECKLWERNLCPSAVVESRTRRPLRKERVSGAVKGVVSTMKKEQDFEHKTTTLGSSFIKSQDWQQPPVIITDVEDLGLNFSERRGVQ